MNSQVRLQALSAFLKGQRAKISPESVGLPPGTRRRTPGLRREEVAQLAGVSTTWYTWLEQGRDIQVSSSVLDCVANALQLNADERRYLYSLALESGRSLIRSNKKRCRSARPCKNHHRAEILPRHDLGSDVQHRGMEPCGRVRVP